MKNVKEFLEKIVVNKKKTKIFLSVELCIFVLLVTVITIKLANRNISIETIELTNGEHEQAEIKQNDDVLVVEIPSEPAQELTDEEQKEAEEKEKITNSKNEDDSSSNSSPSGYSTSYYIKVKYQEMKHIEGGILQTPMETILGIMLL